MREVEVVVTESHIEQGVRFMTSCCALALAISDAVGFQCWVGISSWGRVNQALPCDLPEVAIVFRRLFDRDVRPLEPLTFMLQVPEDL